MITRTAPESLPRLSYTIAETAKATGVSERHLRRLAASGELCAVRFAGRVLVPAAVFERLITDAPSAAL